MPEIQTNNLVDRGQLKIQVTSRQRAVPIPNATIEISYTGDPDSVLETVSTDENGQTPVVDLPAPPVEYSLSLIHIYRSLHIIHWLLCLCTTAWLTIDQSSSTFGTKLCHKYILLFFSHHSI